MNARLEDFMNHQFIPGAPEIVNWMIPAVIMSFVITLVIILPLLLWLGTSVKRTIKDSKENWHTVKTVPTQGYVYQVHKETGQRRTFSLLAGDTKVNKDWLKGKTDVA